LFRRKPPPPKEEVEREIDAAFREDVARHLDQASARILGPRPPRPPRVPCSYAGFPILNASLICN
jgi:hypothetical protein